MVSRITVEVRVRSLICPRFIPTPLMSQAVVERLSSQLKSMGSGFAETEDCVRAVMRIATDPSVNGKPCGINLLAGRF